MAQLHLVRDRVAAAVASVVVVGHGDVDGARKWKAEVGHEFQMVVDETKKLYSDLLGFKSGSRWTVWGGANFLYYMKALWSGRSLPSGTPGADIYQLGGDAIIGGKDGKGEILFTYPSSNPADRPAIDRLIEELMKFKQS